MTPVLRTPALRTLQIGLIASPTQTSGSDRYYCELVRAVRELDVGVTGVVLGDPAAFPVPTPGVASFAPEGSGAKRRWTGLREAVRPLVPEANLLVSHFAPHAFPVLDLVRHLPLVEHFHGPWALEGRFGHQPLPTIVLREVQERLVYGKAKRIIVLSRSFGDVLERHYRVPGDKIRLVPGGADLTKFDVTLSKREARERLALPLDRQIVFTVRRLESTKGVDRLIEAAADVVRDVPDALFVIAGTGTMRPAFDATVRDRGLERNVQFAGFVDEAKLALLYRSADLCVVPSVAWEGFGLVCIESLASGTPVLVTPIGGLPEAVAGLDASLVLAGCEATDLARGIRSALLGDVPLPSAEACRNYALGFSWPSIARRVVEVYREVA